MERDQPETIDLLRVAAEAMKRDILPNLAAEKHLDALMILSILSAAERDLADAGGLDERQRERLQSILPSGGGVAELCAGIRDGQFDDPAAYRALHGCLLEDVRDRLTLVNPKYLAMADKDAPER